MRIVLLGPDGQLGSDIRRANEALAAPHEIVPVGRAALDVSVAGAARERLGGLDFDVLVNCTSYHRTDEVEGNGTLAVAVNSHAVRELAEVCRDRRARFVHISTDYVFGGGPGGRPYREDDPVAPVNVYGATKALGETLARLAGGDVTILRVASLFGITGASGKGGNFVETMIRLAREKGALRVVDDQIMSPTATIDIARTLLTMLERGTAPGIYHVVNSEGGVSWCAFAREIVRQAGIAAEVEAVDTAAFPTRAMRPAYSALDNARVSAEAGPLRSWRDALAEYLRDKGHTAS